MAITDQFLTPEVVGAIIAVVLAFLAYITKKLGDLTAQASATHAVAVANQQNINSINTAQTAQIVAGSGTAPATVSNPDWPYRYMTDAAKASITGDPNVSQADKDAFIQQVAINEKLGNVRYIVVLSTGALVVENGCLIGTSSTLFKKG